MKIYQKNKTNNSKVVKICGITFSSKRKLGDVVKEKRLFGLFRTKTNSFKKKFYVLGIKLFAVKTQTMRLNQADFDRLVNCIGLKTQRSLTVAEASYLASLAKSIIGLRTGFIELLAALKERGPLYTLYTPFRKIDSENFLSTYSLKNYPFIQTNNIVELTTSQDNYEIVLDIFQKEL